MRSLAYLGEMIQCLIGSAFGTRENRRFTFTGKVNLRAGTNRIALLSVAVGLPVITLSPTFAFLPCFHILNSKLVITTLLMKIYVRNQNENTFIRTQDFLTKSFED